MYTQEEIREIVASQPSKELKTKKREEIARLTGLSINAVRAITAWTKIYKSKNRYNNPTKNAWRQKLVDFITSNMIDYRDRTVMCMPGEQCLEADRYLEIGIKPSNIYALERKPTPKFLNNINKRKINYIKSIEEVRCDICSLDYMGPVHGGLFGSLNKLRTKDDKDFILAINVAASRESQETQKYLNYRAVNGNYSTLQEYFKKVAEHKPEHIDVLRNTLVFEYFDELHITKKQIGVKVEEDPLLKLLYAIEQLPINKEHRVYLSIVIACSARAISWEEIPIRLNKIKSYWYKSEDGGKRYLSDFLYISPGKNTPRKNVLKIQNWVRNACEMIKNGRVMIEYRGEDRFRKIKESLEAVNSYKVETLTVDTLINAEKELIAYRDQCLCRRFCSDEYKPPEREQIVP